jgi:hypothetical protein
LVGVSVENGDGSGVLDGVLVGVTVLVGVCVGVTVLVGVIPLEYESPLIPQSKQSAMLVGVTVGVVVWVLVGVCVGVWVGVSVENGDGSGVILGVGV